MGIPFKNLIFETVVTVNTRQIRNVKATFVLNCRANQPPTTGIMKVPPTADDQIISNAVENNTAESDDGLNEAPHSPSREGDFSEYLWMENEEEFEQQIMQQLEEEALMQQCIEAMQDEMNPFSSSTPSAIYLNGNSNHTSDDILTRGIQNLSVDENTTGQSKLNPDAAEFVPRTNATSKDD